ncbi:MAG: hypothetical protein H0U73_01870 [Tatlockia sp.]|nr:hypothetical protein [Tatlockia sp.]
MTNYIYVPYTKKEVPTTVAEHLNKFIKSNNEKDNEVIVMFSGKHGLDNLPTNAKVFVLMHGQPGKVNKFKQSNTTVAPLGLTDRKNSKSVPDIAKEMIADGLFENSKDTRICIELYFTMNAAKEKGHTIAESFSETLKKNTDFNERAIRIDYYSNQRNPSGKSNASPIKHSIYGSELCQPKLSKEQVKEAIIEYVEYKSSRFCGLSGILGLNRFFTSNESIQTIQSLQSECSDEKRFQLAKQFLAKHSENAFAQCLKLNVEKSKVNNDLSWSAQSTPVEGMTI